MLWSSSVVLERRGSDLTEIPYLLKGPSYGAMADIKRKDTVVLLLTGLIVVFTA